MCRLMRMITLCQVRQQQPATGTITSAIIVLNGLTSASGIINDTDYDYKGDLVVDGWVRKATGGTLYKQTALAGTIAVSGFALTIGMISDE